jgi:DNA modification methylase
VSLLKPYYDRSGITIHHGDCLEVLPSLPSESIDFVLTDPPYLVGYKGRWDSQKKLIIGDEDPT